MEQQEIEINEVLQLSQDEELIMWELYEKIKKKHDENSGKFSREIILSHIDSLLKYSDRFYKMKFIDRSLNFLGTMVKKF